MLVSDVNRLFVTQWVRGFDQARPPKALTLVGPCGCGMSTLATLCLRESRYDIVELNASTYPGRAALRLLLRDVLSLPIRRAVLVEEPEAMVSDGGLAELAAFAKGAPQRRKAVPVVAVCNRHKKPKVGPLLQAAERVDFAYLARSVLERRLGCRVPPGARGDLRQLTSGGLLGLPSAPDSMTEVNEATTAVLEGRGGRDAYPSDWPTVTNLVHQNYLGAGGDITAAARGAESLSAGDAMAGGDEEQAFLAGPVACGAAVRACPRTLAADKVWTNYATALSRGRGLQAAKPWFEAAGTVVDVHSMQAVRRAVLRGAAAEEWAGVAAWIHPSAGADEVVPILMGVLRLGPPSDRTAHSRIRRAFKRAGT